MLALTISASAARVCVASSMHHPETRRAERFPKIPTPSGSRSVRVCGKKSGDIHKELKKKFTTGGARASPRAPTIRGIPEDGRAGHGRRCRRLSLLVRVPDPLPPRPPHPLDRPGGGYKGFCDYEEIKNAIKECDGLDGARLEACYAEFGCDVDRVTEHYAKAAGIDPKKTKK